MVGAMGWAEIVYTVFDAGGRLRVCGSGYNGGLPAGELAEWLKAAVC
jgi:hypothetical protein